MPKIYLLKTPVFVVMLAFLWAGLSYGQDPIPERKPLFKKPADVSYAAELEKPVEVRGLVFDDTLRTRRWWVEHYLRLTFPMEVDGLALSRMRSKLMTTGVFKDVVVGIRNTEEGRFLVVEIDEKWTTIPVIRGQFGGGTPLTVFGIYNTHAFGSLLTLGAETRKYGDAERGGVAWARSPRLFEGKHSVSLEFWVDRRVRSAYSRSGEELVRFTSEANRLHGHYLHPIPVNGDDILAASTELQAGLDFDLAWTKPLEVENIALRGDPNTAFGLSSIAESQQRSTLLATVIYDNVESDNELKHGIRLLNKLGGIFSGDEKPQGKYEFEGFVFYLERPLNLSLHYKFGGSGDRSYYSQYFLGGFDSIRGIPDGAITGRYASFGNLEVRYDGWRWKYLASQWVVFIDAGSAAQEVRDLPESHRSAVGVGVRLSVPQIYRLLLRIDYAWAVDGSNTQGINIGLGQLFQPYRPL